MTKQILRYQVVDEAVDDKTTVCFPGVLPSNN